jgi:hypothetical protein
MLALGYAVSEIKKLYRELADEVFKRPFWRFGIIVSKFPEEPLEKALETYLGKDVTLSSDKIQTGLMVMTKRLDTGSPWPLHNSPFGPYFNPKPGTGTAIANKDFLLSRIVRASTAAPHYFEPERISVAMASDGTSVDGAFVDGGVSPSNNPALQLLMLAALEGYGFRWPLGADSLLLVSVGTGTFSKRLGTDEVMGKPAAELAFRSLLTLMDDCDALNQTLLQWMARTPVRWEIDREIRKLENDRLCKHELLTYLRYNAKLEPEWLRKSVGMEMIEAKVKELAEMDKPKNVADLAEVGRRTAEAQVNEDHFPKSFDCG